MTDTFAHELKSGDIITDGYGVYRVNTVTEVQDTSILHISVSTIAGRVMGGLTRGRYEMLNVLAIVERDVRRGIEGTPAR